MVGTALLALRRGISSSSRAQLHGLLSSTPWAGALADGPVPVAGAVAADREGQPTGTQLATLAWTAGHTYQQWVGLKGRSCLWSESKALSSPSQLPEVLAPVTPNREERIPLLSGWGGEQS